MRSSGNANLWAIVLSILGMVFGLIALVFSLAGLAGCGSAYVDELDVSGDGLEEADGAAEDLVDPPDEAIVRDDAGVPWCDVAACRTGCLEDGYADGWCNASDVCVCLMATDAGADADGDDARVDDAGDPEEAADIGPDEPDAAPDVPPDEGDAWEADAPADVEPDAVPDVPDAEPDVPDIELDAGPDEATDAGPDDAPPPPCAEGWLDPATGLCWENPGGGVIGAYDSAVAYCAVLRTMTGQPWRLPTITQLRSLIRGCAGTDSGSGSCPVSDGCTALACAGATLCPWCEALGGPAPAGCYWPDALSSGSDCGWYWSSTPAADRSGWLWGVGYNNAAIYPVERTCSPGRCWVRCVRDVI